MGEIEYELLKKPDVAERSRRGGGWRLETLGWNTGSKTKEQTRKFLEVFL